jgi:MFS family permease
MTTMAATPPRFDMGRVIQRTFGTVGRNWVTFAILALPLSALPQALLQMQMAGARGLEAPALGFGFGVALIALVGGFILQAGLTYGSVADLNGRKASLGECLSVGLRNILPLLGLSILMGLALAAGFILLIVPGVLMALAWSVAVPSLVVERTGVFGAFRRSGDLTRNHRGAIFLLALAFWCLSLVIGAVAAAVFAIAGPAVSVVVLGLVRGAETLIGAAGVASIYYELRSIKEGVGPEALAAVFD